MAQTSVSWTAVTEAIASLPPRPWQQDPPTQGFRNSRSTPGAMNINVSPYLIQILKDLQALEESGQIGTTMFVRPPEARDSGDPPAYPRPTD